MPQYHCKIVPLRNIMITSQGMITPLCDQCKSKDCENPIENQDVSLYGINTKMRVWNNKSHISVVLQCDGFNP